MNGSPKPFYAGSLVDPGPRASSTELELDEEMEKVFAEEEREPKFSLDSITEQSNQGPRDSKPWLHSPSQASLHLEERLHLDNEDYQLHRRDSFPLVHLPLHSKMNRPKRNRRGSSATSRDDEARRKGSHTYLEMDNGVSSDNKSRSSTGNVYIDMDDGLSSSDGDGAKLPKSAIRRGSKYAQKVSVDQDLPEEDDETDMEFSPLLLPSFEHAMSKQPVNLLYKPVYRGRSTSPEPLKYRRDSSPEHPQISERAQTEPHHDVQDKKSKVQFEVGSSADISEDHVLSEIDKEERDDKRKFKHSKRHRILSEDPIRRQRSGSDIQPIKRVATEPEEACTLPEGDLDDIASHRYDKTKRNRKISVQAKNCVQSFVHVGSENAPPSLIKKFDRSPHEIFVELDELRHEDGEMEWKETARWIKYEENVEEDADRWGKPHVASLSFHSLLNLRKCLETGVILLDLEEVDLPGVAHRVVEKMVLAEQIKPDEQSTVLRALLLRHKHPEKDRFKLLRRSASNFSNVFPSDSTNSLPRNASDGGFRSASSNNFQQNGSAKFGDKTAVSLSLSVDSDTGSQCGEERNTKKSEILKKIPAGAEATTVLVGSVDFLEHPTIAFVRLAKGAPMSSTIEVPIPVRFMFILLGPLKTDLDYHEVGRAISTLMSNERFQEVAYKADGRRDLLSAINEFLDYSIVLPPVDWDSKSLLPLDDIQAKSRAIRQRKNMASAEQTKKIAPASSPPRPPEDDPLLRTRKPFGGFIKDIKRRYPMYLSDLLDGLNPTCLATMIFIYFACLSGGVAFGGLYADKTDNLIGVSETLVGTCIVGTLFALLSGQPLIILGANGPMLLFDQSLFSFCDGNGLDFLVLRVWTGIWLLIIAIVLVAFEGSMIVKLCTRFTRDIFTSLICLIFIYEGMAKLVEVYRDHPLRENYCDLGFVNSSDMNATENPFIDSGNFSSGSNDTVMETLSRIRRDLEETKADSSSEMKPQPNTALLCTILMLGTFFIAYFLRQFRNSKFLGRSARRALGDFGVPIAIVLMVIIDYFIKDTYTQKLSVPEGLTPSDTNARGWFISPIGKDMPIWVPFASVIPAVLAFILLFLELAICQLIMGSPERGLRKGGGFHLDVIVLCGLNSINGFIGAPWIAAATVRSVAHLSALTIMSQTHAPGTKPHVAEVKEQRLSASIVSVLVGVSVLMAPLLRMVPMAVLFGIFLYMGVSSMSGVQMLERVKLLFMPVKHHPNSPYVRKVRTWKMHMYTMIQVACLVILWVVKSSTIALAFPFFLLLLVPLRFQLKHIFSPKELFNLDGDADQGDEEEDEPDFYEQAPLP